MEKKSKLNKQDLKNILYGSIYELAKDRKNYYHSNFGNNYSHFTTEGEKAVLELLQVWVYNMLETEERELDRRAKDMVIKELKGENNQSV